MSAEPIVHSPALFIICRTRPSMPVSVGQAVALAANELGMGPIVTPRQQAAPVFGVVSQTGQGNRVSVDVRGVVKTKWTVNRPSVGGAVEMSRVPGTVRRAATGGNGTVLQVEDDTVWILL